MDAEGAAAGNVECAGSPSLCSGVNVLQGECASKREAPRAGGVAEQGRQKK